jgi:hypothetical protein
VSDIEIKVAGKSGKIKALLIILAVSVASPLALHYALKEKAPDPPPPPPPLTEVELPPAKEDTLSDVYFEKLDLLVDKVTELSIKYDDQILLREFESTTQTVPEEENLTINWLNSPVTQAWKYDEDDMAYKTASKDSYRSPPSIIIGLRSDGVVVWRKK